jgi:hypothetical protein
VEGENVIGYMDNLVSFGIIAPKRRSLILTNQRMLLVDVSNMSTTAASAGFAYVFGVFGRSAANKISKEDIEETTKKLSQANLDDLLKSNPENMAIDNSNVAQVEIDRKQIVIKANDGKTFKYGLANPDVKNKKSDIYETYVTTLQNIFGSKVIAK